MGKLAVEGEGGEEEKKERGGRRGEAGEERKERGGRRGGGCWEGDIAPP